jgi:[CysO sulfur-carrier protein]-S-L-cysteine hydrolase
MSSEHPWIHGQLRIGRSVVDAIENEARAAYERNEEACGFLTGPSTESVLVNRSIIMPNLANKYHAVDPETYPRKGNEYFLIDSRKFQKAMEEGTTSGQPIKVLWHSHLDVGAYFSETDAQAATMGGTSPTYELAYLVTSIRKGVVDDHRLFIWEPESQSFQPSTFELIEDSEPAAS